MPDDVRTGYFFSQLEILKVLIEDAQINCFADVLKAVKSLTDRERHMITEVIVICKLLLVNLPQVRQVSVRFPWQEK